jgi:hypothetical protein
MPKAKEIIDEIKSLSESHIESFVPNNIVKDLKKILGSSDFNKLDNWIEKTDHKMSDKIIDTLDQEFPVDNITNIEAFLAYLDAYTDVVKAPKFLAGMIGTIGGA